MNPAQFAPKLLRWYERHHRDLPWRQTADPYRIWLSEVILQQTRVAQGLPYYERFVETFPTVGALAAADEREVLRLWQGLGYYSRARNLHQTAKLVAGTYGGQFPTTYAGLLQLRGIGPYTAAAIASFAFGERAAVVDGNVFRVLARVFGIETDIASGAAKKEFTLLANELISPDDPATYNHAIMDFGATQCVPVSPQCLFCPFAFDCEANATGRQAVLPVKSRKGPVRQRFFHYLALEHAGTLALRERTGRDVWAGLYDFYLVEADAFLSPDALAERDAFWREIRAVGTLTATSEPITHVLSHQRIAAQFFRVRLPDSVPSPTLPAHLRWYTPDEIDALPKPVLMTNYLVNQNLL
jgi:A/G-specific adenine glycosylase